MDESPASETNEEFGFRTPPPLVRRVSVSNYKSIGSCSVEPQPLTILVGRNGAGKSNFLDALRFVHDSLKTSLDHALRDRGGLGAVRRISTGHPRNFAIELELSLPEEHVATYGFEIASRRDGGYAVKRERLRIRDVRQAVRAHYSVTDAEVTAASAEHMMPASSDRLYLVNASGLPEFRPVYDVLLLMGFYSLNPEVIRDPQSPDAGDLLHRDGSNIASVVGRLAQDDPEAKDRIESYLAAIVPGILGVDRVPFAKRETLEFRRELHGASHPRKSYAGSMSDGTLQVLGTLVAAFQPGLRNQHVRLVGIEEPETALHPHAAGALMNALTEATENTQVVLTTHSSDLIEGMPFDPTSLLVVDSRAGDTLIAPADRTSQQAIRDQLYTAGELHRMNQLEPDEEALVRQLQRELIAD